MATVIKIKNTDQSKLPVDGSNAPVIATGELAYSSQTPPTQANYGGRMYIGTGDDSSTGFSPTYQVVGGAYFTSMLDHVHGTVTAASAVILDANKKVDEWNVDNLIMNGNTLSINQTSDVNGNITIAPGGTGELIVTGPATVNGTFDVVGLTTLTGSLAVTVNTTMTGTLGVTGHTSLSTLGTSGEATLASAIVSDLTAGRVTFAGTAGAIVDSGNLLYNTSSGLLTVTGSLAVDNIKLDANTISTLSGSLLIAPAANAETIISSTSALRVPAGNSSERPGTAVTGQIRYNSTTTQFEGYSSAAWQGLGGVIDADQNTYIIAAPSSNLTVPSSQVADTIYFVTGGAFQGKIDTASGLTINNVNVDGNTVATTSGDLYLDPGSTGAGSPTGNVVVYGNLSVMGDTTTVNSNTITVDDPVFTLGGDTAPSADDNKDRGIEFRWHNGSAAKVGFFGYDDSVSRFKFIADATNVSEVFAGDAGDAEFGQILIDGFTLSAGNFGGGNSVPFFNTSGVMGFLVDDASSAYGTTGQMLQTTSAGTPFFGHIDCGTY
jgi:hypothetical protein